MRRFIAFAAIQLAVYNTCVLADDNSLAIEGAGGGALSLKQWDESHGGWLDVEYESPKAAFRIYGLPGKLGGVSSGTSVSTDLDMVSPDKHFVIVQRTASGLVSNEEGKDVESDQAFCDVVSLDTGCVEYSGGIAQCDGNWDGNRWKMSSGGYLDLSKSAMPPRKLISEISKLSSNQARSNSLRDLMYMGPKSYMACFPPEENISQYNDLGFYFAQGGEHALAMQIYNRLLTVSPERIPLQLNVADSLWALGKQGAAKSYYSAYRDAMQKKGSESKIPQRVSDRAE